jgi:hypothetical protein
MVSAVITQREVPDGLKNNANRSSSVTSEPWVLPPLVLREIALQRITQEVTPSCRSFV